MKETLRIIHEMHHAGVIGQYAIGGAVGATFYLEPVSTLDVDVFITFESQSGPLVTLTPVYDYLTQRGCSVEGEHILIEGWPVRFLPPGSPLEEEAVAQAVETDVEGVTTRVMTAEHLVAIALKTNRTKDKLRIVQFMESSVVNRSVLEDLLARHDLLEQWRRFSDRYLSDG